MLRYCTLSDCQNIGHFCLSLAGRSECQRGKSNCNDKIQNTEAGRRWLFKNYRTLTSQFSWPHRFAWLGSIKMSRLMTKPTKRNAAPSEDSDQPGHPPILIRVFTVRMKKAWVLIYPLSAQRRLWSDWVDAQVDLSLRWAHSHFVDFVVSRLKWYSRLLFFHSSAQTVLDVRIVLMEQINWITTFFFYNRPLKGNDNWVRETTEPILRKIDEVNYM